MLLFRAPEIAPLKSKMIYASSKDAIKKKFTGNAKKYKQNKLHIIYSTLYLYMNGKLWLINLKL